MERYPEAMDQEYWAATLKKGGFVPDPMILRTADLFAAGGAALRKPGGDGEKRATETWDVIARNVDGLIAFFDLLLTREQIPLIDYDYTYPGFALSTQLGELAVNVHPNSGVYGRLKKDAIAKIQSIDFSVLSDEVVKATSRELSTMDYGWFPDPNRPDLDPERQAVARLVLGGVVFGGYAQIIQGDHVLQTNRSRLFAQLVVPEPQEALQGPAKEKRLFQELREYVNHHDAIRTEDVELAPSLLPHLLRKHPKAEPAELVEEALKLRESPIGRDYRAWFVELRSAWVRGLRAEDAEAPARAVLRELRKRFPRDPATKHTAPADQPIWATKLEIGAEVGLNAGPGPVELKATAGLKTGEVRVGLPNRIRSWIIDHLPMKRHRKLLLRMSLDAREFEDITADLRRRWFQGV